MQNSTEHLQNSSKLNFAEIQELIYDEVE